MHPFHRILPAVIAFACAGAGAEEWKPEVRGTGWIEAGLVEHSTPVFTKASADPYSGNWVQKSGAMLDVSVRIDRDTEARLSMGALQTHVIGGREDDGAWYPFIVPFLGEASIRHSRRIRGAAGGFDFTAGYFPYGYNPDTRNLGMYLLRGYVYPGTLVSGFGNVFGVVAGYGNGGFRNELILNSEMEDRPFFDYSVANIMRYEVVSGFEIGAGVNLYRLIRAQERSECVPNAFVGSECAIVDTAKGDTLSGSLAGTKWMGRFRLDPKRLFGFGDNGPLRFGKNDLVLYGEAAVLGLRDYPVYYPRIRERIPVMLGIGLPAFTWLDILSLEVEYYGSKHSSDTYFARFGSWIPADNYLTRPVDFSRDDWKWSVSAEKTLSGRITASLLFANDHLRFGGTHDHPNGVEATNTPSDWYWTCKLAFSL